MIVIDTSPNIFYSRKEVWFNTDKDILIDKHNNLFYQSSILPKEIKEYKVFRTLIIDLMQESGDIFNKINKTFKYDILRAEREGIFFSNNNSQLTIERFYQIHLAWCSEKKMSNLNRLKYNKLVNSGNFIILHSHTSSEDVVYHSYIFDETRVRLLLSHHNASIKDKKIVGFANKFLHWQAICYFKSLGFKEYDFGGYDEIKAPGIAKFKLSFGGESEESFNFNVTKGLIYKSLMYLLGFIKKIINAYK